ncbi:FAD-binding protein [Candidatus Sodalis pierantonius]
MAEQFEVVVIGAGAAGMFCVAQAGQLGRRVLLLQFRDPVHDSV